MFNNIKKHKWFMLILFISIIFFYVNSYFDLKTINQSGEEPWHITRNEFIRESVYKREFPHWIPYHYGGTPFFSNAQNMYFNLITLTSLITPSVEANIKVEVMLAALIGCISIYFLMLELKINPKFAVLSTIIYMFNSFPLRRMVYGAGDEFVDSHIWIPLIFLLTLKFINSRDYKKSIVYSILAGIALAAQFHHGYVASFIYTYFSLICFLLVYTILNGFNTKLIKKIIFYGVIMGIIFLGLGAIKILPLLEFSKYSSLSGPRSFEDAKGYYFKIDGLKDIFKPIVFMATTKMEFTGGYDRITIGVIPLIFLFFSLFKFKNKYVICSFILILILLLVASGSPLFYPLWKFFPGFNRQHHIGRIITMVLLPASILVGVGAQCFFNTVEKKFKLKKWIIDIIYIIIIILVLINLNFFTGKQYYGVTSKYSLNEILNQNELFQYFTNDNDIFRVHNIKDINIGGRSDMFAVIFKQEIIQGAFNVWIPEYINEYFWAYSRFDLFKFLGMLNTKYIYSDYELNESNLRFIKKFNECRVCREKIADDYNSNDGPYLYLNELYLPRAYMVDKAILVIGDYNEAKGTMYALMINNNFNPASVVVVIKQGLINNQDPNFLKKFKAIILTKGSIDQNSGYVLKDYKDSGGILLPDIIDGKNVITEEDVNKLLISFKGDYKNIKKLNITDYSLNKREIKLNDEKGFLVLSEKFSIFGAWKAKINNKNKEILRANGINSAIYIEEPGNIILEYKSESFRKGAMISLITLIIISIYFVFHFFYLKQKNEK